MNIPALQRADRWFGIPLCAVCTVLRRIAGGRRPKAELPRRLLVVKLAEQGSTVLAYPMIRAAVEWVGTENVTFLVFAPSRPILDALGMIPPGNIVEIQVDGVGAFVGSVLRAIRILQRRRIDAAIDLDFFSRGSALLSFLSGARESAGLHVRKGGPYRGDLFTRKVPHVASRHATGTFLALFEAVRDTLVPIASPRAADAPVRTPLPTYLPTAAEVRRVTDLAFGTAEPRPRLILLNPNTSDLIPLRRWPRERYADLARRLLAAFPDVVVGITGAPAEAVAVERFVTEVNSARCRSFGGRTTLRELLTLYGLAEVLVTNDSGPAHFAAMTPVHVVVLFGPENPRLFAARSSRTRVLWAGLPCSPCVSALNQRTSSCGDNQCMQAISVDAVMDAVTATLATRTKVA